MCDTYVNSVGYVCGDCQTEFKEYLKIEGKTDLTEGEIKLELERFMNTTKVAYLQEEKINIDDFFNNNKIKSYYGA